MNSKKLLSDFRNLLFYFVYLLLFFSSWLVLFFGDALLGLDSKGVLIHKRYIFNSETFFSASSRFWKIQNLTFSEKFASTGQFTSPEDDLFCKQKITERRYFITIFLVHLGRKYLHHLWKIPISGSVVV